MLANLPGVPAFTYQEKTPGSPVYAFTNAASRVERTFICSWVNRINLVRFLIGYPTIASSGKVDTHGNPIGSGFVSRLIPDSMPDCLVPGKDDPWLFATSIVRMVGSGETGIYDDDGIAQYQEAILTVSYEPRTYKILPDVDVLNNLGLPDDGLYFRYITRMQKPSAEFIQLPRGTMRWVDGIKNADNKTQPVDYASARLIPSQELAITWHEVPFIPEAATAFVGCLNKLAFTILSADDDTPQATFLPGTLLLLAAEIKPYRTAAGVFVQDVTYRIKYQDPPNNGRGFNYFLRNDPVAQDLVYEKLTFKGNNDSLAILPDSISKSPYNPGDNGGRGVPLVPDTDRGVYAYAGFDSLFKSFIDPSDQVVGD